MKNISYKIGLGIATAALAFTGACGGSSGTGSSGNAGDERTVRSIVDTYFDAAERRDFKRIYNQFCKGFKRYYTYDQFNSLIAFSTAIGRTAGFENWEIEDLDMGNNRASADVSWTKRELSGDRKIKNTTLYFRKEDGKWVLDTNERHCD